MSKGKILFQLSGSIACYKACHVVSRLVLAGYELEVVATRNALKFVGEATLEGLTGKPVHTDEFSRGGAMKHIDLIRWADLAILCPASANTLAKMASGLGDDLVTTLFLAHDFKKPYLVAPAMNTQMLRHPAIDEAMKRLTSWGVEIMGSASGQLACGEVGEGRLLEPDQIVGAIEARFESSPKLKILVTSGGTREPIDGVRSIANTSTGKTGAQLADYLRARNHDVTFLHAKGSVSPSRPGDDVGFVTYGDLEKELTNLLSGSGFDAVIHAAAVSDFSVESVDGSSEIPQKIESSRGLSIRLKENAKLVDRLKAISRNDELKVVAFKLTNTSDLAERREAVKKLATRAQPDLIVHNDLSEIDERRHLTTLYSNDMSEMGTATTKQALAESLERWLAKGFSV